MSVFRLASLLVGLAAVVAFAGCGGGGGPTPTPQPPVTPPLSGRYIAGTVISSVGGRGVDGVVVRLGVTALADTTENGGKFEINVGSADVSLPAYFQVDTTGAGATFPPSGLVTYKNGQTYYPDLVDMPVEILNGDTDSLGTVTVTEVTDTSNPPGVPYPSKDTVILGRVVRASDGSGAANVRIDFGWTPVNISRTGTKGYFAVNLGRDATVLPLFPADTWPPTFKIDTSSVSGLPPTLPVEFNGQESAQDAIVVPTEVLTSQTTTLGTITVLDDGGDDNNPPQPPGPPSL